MLTVEGSLRPKERLFTSLFLRSLLVAVILHGGAYLIFDIHAPLVPTYRPLRPIFTTSEIPDSKQGTTTAHVALPMPEISSPELPEMSGPLLAAQYEARAPIPPFDIYSYHPYRPGELFESSYSPISLTVSGNLGTRPILFNPTPTDRVVGRAIANRVACFLVQLDEQTGTIFWMENRASSGDPALDREAERLIKSLRFAPHRDTYITEGIIEVRFASEGSQS